MAFTWNILADDYESMINWKKNQWISESFQKWKSYLFKIGQITYELNQLTLGGDYFGITTTGNLYVKSAITSLPVGATYSMTATARDGGLLSDTADITIIIPSTTTTTAATTTDRSKTFFEDPRNIAWFTAAMVVLALTIGLILYMCIRYGFHFKKYQYVYYILYLFIKFTDILHIS